MEEEIGVLGQKLREANNIFEGTKKKKPKGIAMPGKNICDGCQEAVEGTFNCFGCQ